MRARHKLASFINATALRNTGGSSIKSTFKKRKPSQRSKTHGQHGTRIVNTLTIKRFDIIALLTKKVPLNLHFLILRRLHELSSKTRTNRWVCDDAHEIAAMLRSESENPIGQKHINEKTPQKRIEKAIINLKWQNLDELPTWADSSSPQQCSPKSDGDN